MKRFIDWIAEKIDKMEYKEKLESIEDFCLFHKLTMEQTAKICEILGVDVEHVMQTRIGVEQ